MACPAKKIVGVGVHKKPSPVITKSAFGSPLMPAELGEIAIIDGLGSLPNVKAKGLESSSDESPVPGLFET